MLFFLDLNSNPWTPGISAGSLDALDRSTHLPLSTASTLLSCSFVNPSSTRFPDVHVCVWIGMTSGIAEDKQMHKKSFKKPPHCKINYRQQSTEEIRGFWYTKIKDPLSFISNLSWYKHLTVSLSSLNTQVLRFPWSKCIQTVCVCVCPHVCACVWFRNHMRVKS